MFSKIYKKDHIMVVDDSRNNRLLIESILAGEGYKITVADSGALAIAEITKSPPDLVLLDIMMPEMDGYEVTRSLRENNDLPFMPILLITAFDRPSLPQGLDIGADDFIRKPFDWDELLARVRSLLRLKHSLDERNHIARQREDFVFRLAHDMRTPLVAADLMLHLLHQGAFGAVPPGIDEALDRIISSNKNLLKMVNELLDVYRYEAGRKNLAFFPINLPDMLSEICAELEPLAMEKQLDLKLNLPDKRDGEVKVLGDVLELRRAFTNLIGNGIKFTDTGFVEIRFHTTATPYLTVEIQDTGPGISTQDRAILFERFRTGNHTRAGSGLGLYLSRQILEAHKGTLELQSQLGAGSLFTVRLPVYS